MVNSRLFLPNTIIARNLFRNDLLAKIGSRGGAISSNKRCYHCLDSKKKTSMHNEASATTQLAKSVVKRGGSQSTEPIKKHDVGRESHRVIIAIGTNLGDRYGNLMKSMAMLEDTGKDQIATKGISRIDYQNEEALVRIVKTSFLRETPPMYVTNQPNFLNGAIEIETRLSPHALLRRLKKIESDIGRNLNGIRNGPRPIDLDIIYYGIHKHENDQSTYASHGGSIIESSDLIIPHPRISEREFVLAPLCDLGNTIIHPILKASTKDMLQSLTMSLHNREEIQSTATRIIPLPRNRFLKFDEILIMGILNVTPDSFSDGGNYDGSTDLAVEQALKMEADGASIIDIGGESTRPGAKEIEVEIELQRTIPVIKRIRQVSDIPISIDTRHATVAKEAILAGADIVNDVSGGTHDPLMLETVRDLHVPIVLMHMRGTPETMQQMTQYENVVQEVSTSLRELSENAERAGIPRWLHILDPGIGFAKDLDQNLSLIKNTDKIREGVSNCTLLLGPSRKGFIGKITGETNADKRDFGTLTSCLCALIGSNGKLLPTILRVHNVDGLKQGTKMFEAIMNAK